MASQPISVSELSLRDIVPDLQILLDGSLADVDGVTIASAEPHPAFDPADTTPGHGALLVTFTDPTGRRRIAEVELQARWREEGCWHLDTRDGELGRECTECGMVTELNSSDARCPECTAPVTDLVTLFGVHTASCTVVMCGCEHIDHEKRGPGHRYLGVRAGSRRAQHVGLVCDECAAGHLADYLLPGVDPADGS